jgi:hypothetical protein
MLATTAADRPGTANIKMANMKVQQQQDALVDSIDFWQMTLREVESLPAIVPNVAVSPLCRNYDSAEHSTLCFET